jgi:undecaprenyl-diphosphatase
MTVDTPTETRPPRRHLSDITGLGSREEATRGYVRSPEDVLRIVVFATATLILMALTRWAQDSITGFEEDLIDILGFLSPTIERVVKGALELLVGLVGVGILLIPLISKRYRLFGYTFLAQLLASILMPLVQLAVDRDESERVVNQLADRAGIEDATTSGSIGIATLAAAFIVLAPFVSRRWRRTGIVIIITVTLLTIVVSVRLPADALLALPLGALCGSVVLLALGRPDRRPTLEAIRAALRNAGLPSTEVRQAKVDARGSTPYFATLDDGTELFVKVLGAQERAADLLFRIYRFLRLKNVGDDRPFSSLRRTIEHEALVALMARDVDVRTPRLRGVVDVGADSMLLAYDMIDGRSLDGLEPDSVTDELMDRIWQQVGVLRRHRIAHRDLRRANVFVGDDGSPWMIDFGFSEVAVPDDLLDADVAQLLASLAVVVGAERAVTAAIDVLGTDAVGEALPRLQIRALSGATQTALKDHRGLLKELQDEVVERCGIERIEFVQLERANRKTIVMIGALVLATYFLFPQFADLPGIIDQIRGAEWSWTPLVILASTLTYIGASISLAGSIPQRLPAGPLVVSSFGSSFASKLAPAGLGGMALNLRFLQKQGVDRAVAASGIGMNTIAGLAGHITLVGVFIVWAGRDAFGSFRLPDPKYFVIGLAVVAALGLVAMAIPATRAMVRERLAPVVQRAAGGVGDVVRRPGKVLMLIGGSVLVTLAYLTTLYFSVEAFGGGLAFATVGAVYLVGSAVAQAAPTPGGLGAVEAALIAGLVAAGLDNTVAVPAVFFYRLFTFWAPILPGWVSFQWLERNDYL